MNKYVSKEIDHRYARLQRSENHIQERGKSIVDLVLTAYLKEDPTRQAKSLDNTFKRFTMNQVKLFLFSGHDTTSSTVCYIFYTMATKPDVLDRLRAEHDSALGPEGLQTASSIAADPFLLNKLPYTSAVIKEVLRLYPAVSSTRAGEPDFHVTDELGRLYPTDDLLLWADPVPIHRDPTYWQRPDEFLAERWLAAPGDPLHPVKGAWRPFEHGPRNCVGQELAMIEMKVITVMTARRFDFKLAYDELDSGNGSQGIKTVYGERGYQIGRAQPAGDLPCRVSSRSDRSGTLSVTV